MSMSVKIDSQVDVLKIVLILWGALNVCATLATSLPVMDSSVKVRLLTIHVYAPSNSRSTINFLFSYQYCWRHCVRLLLCHRY